MANMTAEEFGTTLERVNGSFPAKSGEKASPSDLCQWLKGHKQDIDKVLGFLRLIGQGKIADLLEKILMVAAQACGLVAPG